MKCRNCNREDCPATIQSHIEWAADIIKSALKVLENAAAQERSETEQLRLKSIYLGVALGEIRHRAVSPALRHHTVEIVASRQISQRYEESEIVQQVREKMNQVAEEVEQLGDLQLSEALKKEKPN